MQLRSACILCAGLAFLLSLNTLDCGFCYDDKVAVQENSDLLPNSPWTNLLWNDFWGSPLASSSSHKSYRPLCVATFRLNYMLHGLQPMGYHLLNLLLHAVVCYLYVRLCALVFNHVWPSLLAGLLFAAHPIHTEAVAGIVGRADILSAFFFLLSFLLYHHHVTSSCSRIPSHTTSGEAESRGGGSWWMLMGSLLCAACAMFSKELGIMAIPVCLAYDMLVLRKHPGMGSHQTGLTRRGVILVSCGVGLLVIRFKLMHSPPTFSTTDNEALSLDFPYRELHWAYLVAVNAWLLLNPSQLLHDYRMQAIPLVCSPWDSRHLATLLTLLALAFLAHSATHRPHSKIKPPPKSAQNGQVASVEDEGGDGGQLTAGLSPHLVLRACLVLTLLPFLPASNLLFPVGFVVAERILYLPSMGFCMLVAHSAYNLLSSKRRLVSGFARVGVALLLVTHSAKTLSRHRDWVSKLSLYSSLVCHYPGNSHMYANMAREYRNMEDYGMAELAYTHSITLAPHLPTAYINFGSLLKDLGRYQQAEQVLRQAIPLLEKDKPADHKTLGDVYTALCNMAAKNSSRLEEATQLCQRAVDVSQESFQAHNSLGAVLMHRGRGRPAIRAFKRAAALSRNSTLAQFNLALAYISAGQEKMAADTLESVLANDHTHTAARTHLDELKRKISIS